MKILRAEVSAPMTHYFRYEIPVAEIPAEFADDMEDGFINEDTVQKLGLWLWEQRHWYSSRRDRIFEYDEILSWEIVDTEEHDG